MTEGAVITEIVEAYHKLGGGWVRVAEIAKVTGLAKEDLAGAIEELMNDEDFSAEPEPFGHRITAADREFAPVIGGEARHLIRWGA
jgi:hypothetical protein